jgi:hypothetical protein
MVDYLSIGNGKKTADMSLENKYWRNYDEEFC